jgi:AAA15 family ATPase/GTPase
MSFEFSRINLFVGANSTGKSSAISAINFIAQSLLQNDIGGVPFSLNNQYEQLGTVKDIIHGNRINTPIGIELGYGDDNEQHKFAIELKYRMILRQLEISSFEYFRNTKSLYYFKTRKDAYDISLSGKRIEEVIPHMTKRRPAFYSIVPVDQVVSRFTGINRGANDKLLPWQVKLLTEVSNAMRNARVELRRQFELYDSLSPFRDQPQRTY